MDTNSTDTAHAQEEVAQSYQEKLDFIASILNATSGGIYKSANTQNAHSGGGGVTH